MRCNPCHHHRFQNRQCHLSSPLLRCHRQSQAQVAASWATAHSFFGQPWRKPSPNPRWASA
eukprot:10101628-Alexandrium_andersonii.AAC.1